MKHSLRITLILLGMFLIAQLLGIFVVNQYAPRIVQTVGNNGIIQNVTTYNLPFGMDPPPQPERQNVRSIVIQFSIVFAIAVFLMLFLMKFKADALIRVWFFAVVTLALGVAFNAFLPASAYSSLIAFAVAAPLSFIKIFRRNILLHNLTELLVYPGIAAIFVAVILSWNTSPILAISIILILISLYDMYAVWHSGFMQRMAKYQIKNLRIFTGFFVPYIGKKEREKLAQLKQSSQKNKSQKVKVNLAILGGGDVVFPIILAGIVLNQLGLLSALIISVGATISLAVLFYTSEKGKFYPAMPFISIGCFIALAIDYLIVML